MSNAMQHQRYITLDGMTNLRDLGGYRTNDGTKTMKWGVVFRGDQPSLVPADVAQRVLVQQLHISSTFDLRGDSEAAAKCYVIPHVCRHAVPIDMNHMDELLPPNANVNEGPVAFRLMQDYYRSLVTAEGPAMGAVVKQLLQTSPSRTNAALIHCTGGKDRTGWAVYALLSLLDITEEEKREDYELTNRCFKIPKEAYEYEGAADLSKEAFNAFWRVSMDYLDAAVGEVKKLGGMEAYAKSHMGLTDDNIQQLRDVMLE
ncbi:hypothetical protein ABB37_02367 [Leptomonas pyrrhocoris]|uniref:Tyrosine specific protein phosphatases domain-containing protein n=1 Tax=Leptomonas pyrrhocoris TaxID=157538 RepID=A0A0N0DYP7_LEPPY|nr:hypothetical protein ABB37_02367 [Leptomonas pyrrhocoris]XP_015662813.1 hypothetical protein ABB37_02367 [Leptomonas pyrrhocoris]XP_015662814.1 hypothetical protein ABB37_02367 [Leptomonas pyrrhocoris]XP_015662815.1 hypothetical protein ABB37_02367 [Leptomonas pyrrhocoris]XP_015662816.1 hypothetical protein ABB37_02367 [Leptomonas pyrrhocoris]XP_015662817.1 hypothetical protein ABB37_02367 [Leptomonas pyrrhocoris]KPA84373.1 hypothetical protein ABB37_02367 [Leptomonas pyrrhocoris]KPA84374|eukprot:XP_015662812.1 hypothetical protein ABB37_02367 [Leptomonas pyrrhocoris]